jgi:hypothetical protein
MKIRDLRLRAILSRSKFDGTSEPSRRRAPAYVHAPREMRRIATLVGRFDHKSREVLLNQVNHLLHDPSPLRLAKCFTYANDRKMTHRIVEAAILNLRRRINLGLLHPDDYDATIELFRILRTYTFEINSTVVCTLLAKHNFPVETANIIATIAHKTSIGIFPKPNYKYAHWKENVIDLWIRSAEHD